MRALAIAFPVRSQLRALTDAAAGTQSAAARLRLSALLLLVIAAPFEWTLLSAGGLALTSVEVAVLVAIGVGAAAAVMERGTALWRTPLLVPAACFLAALAMAALLAPLERANAIKFVGRMAAAGGVVVLTLNAARTVPAARVVARTVVALASAVGVVAMLEAAQLEPVMRALTLFRPGFHVVGGQVRATSTLFYPTIASMYLEIAFALGLWLLVQPQGRRPGFSRIVTFLALTAIAGGIVATFTRAGLIAMASSIALVGGLLAWRARALDRRHLALATLTIAIAALVLISRSPQLLVARWKTEGSQAWYGAQYYAPATLRLITGREYQIPLTLTNTGRIAWDSQASPPFAMSYHWLHAGSNTLALFEGWRTPFSAPVGPGASTTLPVNVKAPAHPGEYVLVWDVVHEGRAWLSTEGVTPSRTRVRVEGARVGEQTSTGGLLPGAQVRPDRPDLWRAALMIARESPLVGIGPDNYRHVYGRYLDLSRWDTRVHANNMYLEVLAGAGALGLLTLLWLMARSARLLWARWRAASTATADLTAACCAVGLTIAGHGLVDSFLSFTTTYVMFAVAAGLVISPALTEARER